MRDVSGCGDKFKINIEKWSAIGAGDCIKEIRLFLPFSIHRYFARDYTIALTKQPFHLLE